jgi:hypothetical protein
VSKPTTETAWRLEKERKRDEAERKRIAAKTPAEERRWRASRDNYKRQLTMGWAGLSEAAAKAAETLNSSNAKIAGN